MLLLLIITLKYMLLVVAEGCESFPRNASALILEEEDKTNML